MRNDSGHSRTSVYHEREPDRAFFLEAWNGCGGVTSDRIGRGTVHVDNLCVSLLGGIQPAKLLAYLYQAASELENDGLIQRVQLLVYPDEPATWQLVDEYPDLGFNLTSYFLNLFFQIAVGNIGQTTPCANKLQKDNIY